MDRKDELETKINLDKSQQIVRDSEYKLLYADRVEFRVSPFDFKLTMFSTQKLPNGEALVIEHATLILSPQHAKHLSEVLVKNVKSYEDTFGKINMEWLKMQKEVEQLAEKQKKK